jgi:hypothetical protein
MMTHAYNPSNSENKDQEDCGSRPAQAKIFLILKFHFRGQGLLASIYRSVLVLCEIWIT